MPIHLPTTPPRRSARERRSPRLHLAVVPLVVLSLAACGGRAATPAASTAEQLSFGVHMAQRGLWSEALFRFHQAERMEPQNPHVQNNLAVAYEANGEFDKALDYYKRALQLAPESREARANYARFVEFYQGFKPKDANAAAPAKAGARPAGREGGDTRPAPPASPPPPSTPPPPRAVPPEVSPPGSGPIVLPPPTPGQTPEPPPEEPPVSPPAGEGSAR